MKLLRGAVCVLGLATLTLASPTLATSYSTDQSDLWYIAAESGWGIQLVQRGSVIFGTMFVYAQNEMPTWYTATMDTSDGITWTGALYATTGPWFGTIPFNPENVVLTQVGTMTWQPQTATTGALNYSVNGTAVEKNVVRQSLVLDNFSGTYLGAVHLTSANCSYPADDLTNLEIYGSATVTQMGTTIGVSFTGQNGFKVSATGTLTQDGQFGTGTGSFTTNLGDAGTGSFFEMNVQINALTASFSLASTSAGCQYTGYIGGIRSRP